MIDDVFGIEGLFLVFDGVFFLLTQLSDILSGWIISSAGKLSSA